MWHKTGKVECVFMTLVRRKTTIREKNIAREICMNRNISRNVVQKRKTQGGLVHTKHHQTTKKIEY